jgi:putative ABC transport system permease protein
MLKISLNSIWAHRRRVVRTCSAVLLGVAFLAGTLVLGDTMRAGFAGAFGAAYSGTDVVVQGATTLGTDATAQARIVPAEVLAESRGLDGVDTAVGWVEGAAQVVGADGEPIGGDGPPTSGGNWVDDPANPYALVEGRAPASSGEIVVDRGTATTGSLEIGDATTVRTPTPVAATVVGIVAFGEEDSIGGSGYIGFTEADAREYLLGGDTGSTSLTLRAADGTSPDELRDRVASTLPEGFEALTGDQASQRATEQVGDEFLDAFEVSLLVFTGVALLVAAFSIFNTFSVVLAQRTRESALLRAVGATRRQVLGSITLEAAIVGVLAAVGGVIVGLGLAVGLTEGMGSLGIDLPGGITVEPSSLLVAAGVGLVVTLVASLAPAVRASRVAPLAALRDAAVDRSDGSRVRTGLGVLLSAAGAALVMVAALGEPDAALAMVGWGAALCTIGVVVLGPVIARPAARLLGAPLLVVRGSTGELARGNAMRNPRRTAGTASALMIGVAVVSLFTVVGSSMSTMIRQSVVGSISSDLLLVDDGMSGSGMSPDLAPRISALDEVDEAVGLGYAAALFGGQEQEFVVTNPELLARSLDVGLRDGSIEDLDDDQLAISTDLAEERGWEVGSTVDVGFIDGTTMPLTVGAVYDDAGLAEGAIMSRATWTEHSTRALDSVIAVTLTNGVGAAEGAAAVDAAVSGSGAPAAQTLDEYADDVAGQINQQLGIVYVLLALSIIIALMGIANTLSLSIHERSRELGLLRAIGQTRGQLRAMVRLESVLIAVFGTVGGIGLGLFLAWGLVSTLDQLVQTATVFSAPVAQLWVIALIGAVAGVLAATRPARRAARLDVLGAIAAE